MHWDVISWINISTDSNKYLYIFVISIILNGHWYHQIILLSAPMIGNERSYFGFGPQQQADMHARSKTLSYQSFGHM